MSRATLLLVALALVLSAFLSPWTGLGTSGGLPLGPTGGTGLHTLSVNSSNSSSSASDTIPPPSCPVPPVNTTFGPFSCFQMLDLTEIFVIVLSVTITLYVYHDADRAELPGDSSEIPVTGEEELALRLRRDEEEEEAARWEEEGGPQT